MLDYYFFLNNYFFIELDENSSHHQMAKAERVPGLGAAPAVL